MAVIQVFPETLVGTPTGSVMVPSMGIIDTHDEDFATFLVETNHAVFYVPPEPPPEEDARKVKK